MIFLRLVLVRTLPPIVIEGWFCENDQVTFCLAEALRAFVQTFENLFEPPLNSSTQPLKKLAKSPSVGGRLTRCLTVLVNCARARRATSSSLDVRSLNAVSTR
ncbi:hypothetical protein TNCT_256301 [Trichonephila clavata]|uniref:Secreted protein n=1 Tax=Trichonephila clavata TaxID=2740835 RepID=A0A8X6L5W1_TRICU|nr:hypothetical protein TNCT_256301 [Trichonephila clavata]